MTLLNPATITPSVELFLLDPTQTVYSISSMTLNISLILSLRQILIPLAKGRGLVRRRLYLSLLTPQG